MIQNIAKNKPNSIGCVHQLKIDLTRDRFHRNNNLPIHQYAIATEINQSNKSHKHDLPVCRFQSMSMDVFI